MRPSFWYNMKIIVNGLCWNTVYYIVVWHNITWYRMIQFCIIVYVNFILYCIIYYLSIRYYKIQFCTNDTINYCQYGIVSYDIVVTMNPIYITTIMICINLHSCMMYMMWLLVCLSLFFFLSLIDNWQLFYKILLSMLFIYLFVPYMWICKNVSKWKKNPPTSNMLHILYVIKNIILFGRC